MDESGSALHPLFLPMTRGGENKGVKVHSAGGSLREKLIVSLAEKGKGESRRN